LAYVEPTRNEIKDLPKMVIENDVSTISLSILVPHSNIYSVTYSINLITPSEKTIEIQKNIASVISGEELDSVKVKFNRKEFIEGNGTYQIKVTELNLKHIDGFKSMDYSYIFSVKIDEKIK
jgi:hypothetical protein